MKRKEYRRPQMRVIELQRHAPLICTSGTGSSGDPNYTPFDKEEEW